MPHRGRTPVPLLVSLAGVGVEVLLLVAVAGIYVLGVVRGREASLPLAVGTAIMALALACLLGAATRGLARGFRWGRAPVLAWQVLQVVISVQLVQAAGTGSVPGKVALALAVLGLVVAVGLLVPRVVRVTSAPRRPSDGSDRLI